MAPTPALYAATPQVAVDGSPSGLLGASLERLVVTEHVDGLFTCEASFQNVGGAGADPDFQFFDTSIIDFGKPMEITAGAGDREGVIFSGHVTGIRAEFPQAGTSGLTVLAEDRLQDLRMTRRTRRFDDMTDADAFRAIAAEQGLRADISLTGPTHTVLAQLDQSDLAFIRERARRVGAEVWVDGDTLHVAQRSDRRTAKVTLSHRQNLREVTLAADLAHQRTAVSVGGWDPGGKQGIDVEAGVSTIAGERAGGAKAGAEVLKRAFGERKDRIVHAVPLSADEAKAIAEARFRAMARRFVVGEALAEGDARLRAGSTAELVGVGPWFSGVYDVVAVDHLFDLDHGYRSVVRLERSEVVL